MATPRLPRIPGPAASTLEGTCTPWGVKPGACPKLAQHPSPMSKGLDMDAAQDKEETRAFKQMFIRKSCWYYLLAVQAPIWKERSDSYANTHLRVEWRQHVEPFGVIETSGPHLPSHPISSSHCIPAMRTNTSPVILVPYYSPLLSHVSCLKQAAGHQANEFCLSQVAPNKSMCKLQHYFLWCERWPITAAPSQVPLLLLQGLCGLAAEKPLTIQHRHLAGNRSAETSSPKHLKGNCLRFFLGASHTLPCRSSERCPHPPSPPHPTPPGGHRSGARSVATPARR